MPDPTKVNAQVNDTLVVLRRSTLGQDVVRASGQGKAYQAVAQSVALAIQDATDNLRNMSTIGATAMGVALAHYMETGKDEHKQALEAAKGIVNTAVDTFRDIGSHAAALLASFPQEPVND